MKYLLWLSLFLFTLTFSSCSVVNGIFKAGMWWAFFLVALVVGIILFVMFKARKK